MNCISKVSSFLFIFRFVSMVCVCKNVCSLFSVFICNVVVWPILFRVYRMFHFRQRDPDAGSFSYFCFLFHFISFTILQLLLPLILCLVLYFLSGDFSLLVSPAHSLTHPVCMCACGFGACVNFNINSGIVFIYQHQISHLRYNVVKLER